MKGRRGKQCVFRGQAQGRDGSSRESVSGEKKGGVFTCFNCGKAGHKAADCWKKGGAAPSGSSKAVSSSNLLSSKIVCYLCGVEGHKSSNCPKPKSVKGNGKDGQANPIRQLWVRDSTDTVLEGVVNGKEASVLLDSGASISIVPEVMVEKSLLTGDSVAVKAFQSKVPMRLPTARVLFEIRNLKWEEVVALAPVELGKESEVLYGLDLKSERELDLVIMANRIAQGEVLRVTTRAQSKKEGQEQKRDAEAVTREKPLVKAVVEAAKDAAEAEVEVGKQGVGKGGPVADRPAGTPKPLPSELEETGSDKSPGSGDPVADRPAGDPESVAQEETRGEEEAQLPSLEALVEAEEEADLGEGAEYSIRRWSESMENLNIPPVGLGSSSRLELVDEVKKDPTLAAWRGLADRNEQGFIWDRDLLYQSRTTHTFDVVHLMVLPVCFRQKVLLMAHEKSGHLGSRKVKALVKQRFIWPGMGQDVVKHTRSCEVCQRCSKVKARKAPLIEREVLTEPFEVLGFDLVGPFPKGKGGFQYVLTAICMSSRWPEAIPLKTITAKAVAAGMVEIFSRTGIPLQLLTDQGSQFLSSLVTHLCRDLMVDKIRMAPYHPECNGVVERMHGTLGPMLTKASQLGLDWVGQLPFALFALRSAPNKDSLFSPFQLVYGHRVRTPLDILHQGWAELSFSEMDTGEWSDWLVERLDIWHGIMRERGKEAIKKRKLAYDKGAVERTLNPGEQVLCRVPGMCAKLTESWHGPYVVEEKKSKVDYKVKVGRGRSKVLHVNNLKRYYPRGEEVLRLALVAEDFEEDEAVGTRLTGCCEGFEEEEVVKLREEFPDVFSDLPGETKVATLKIKTGEAGPIASHPYRIPDRLKNGVKEELEKLIGLGIVVPSTSPWASPIVPVPKGDGTVRVCIDYRKLNEVTIADPYYMCTLEEILERVGTNAVISKLDLAKGFYQVVVEPLSRAKTAFICPFGKYEFTRMPFGLRNVPAIFQRVMEVVLGGCYEYAAPYIDDVVVFSKDVEDHVIHLRRVLEELRKHGMTVKGSKCEFGKKKLVYLGHVIGGGELAVPAHRAAAMANYLLPKTKKQLRSFLGAAGYYRQFVEGYAKLSSVLSPWTSKSAPGAVCWTREGLEAFDKIKVSLVDVCCLTIPTQKDVFTLHCDASGAGIGATLNVWRDGKEKPVAFYSKQLQGAQHNYCATELEGLAVFKSIHFFAHYLYGCRFEVVTDHKALVGFLHSRILNRRLHGWLLQLLQFDFVISYRPGRENLDADALSRQSWDSRSGDPMNDSMLRTAQSLVVGGDVGPTHIEGGAQEPAPTAEEDAEGEGGAQAGCRKSQKTNRKWSPGKRKHVTEIEESRRVEGHETVAVAEGVRHACG